MRGATVTVPTYYEISEISIHAPHAGRDLYTVSCCLLWLISIHAPHAGRDFVPQSPFRGDVGFQSTRPMRGATFAELAHAVVIVISIHAPHAGRDNMGFTFVGIDY